MKKYEVYLKDKRIVVVEVEEKREPSWIYNEISQVVYLVFGYLPFPCFVASEVIGVQEVVIKQNDL